MKVGHAPMRARYLGSYTHQLDEKGRVSLPASFRREAADQRYVLLEAYAGSLVLYPEVEWGKVEERLLELQARNPKARSYVLSVVSTAVEVTPDAQGRILIPAKQKEAAGLDGQVVLVGAVNRVELWEPTRFEAMTAAAAPEWGQYAEQIFQ